MESGRNQFLDRFLPIYQVGHTTHHHKYTMLSIPHIHSHNIHTTTHKVKEKCVLTLYVLLYYVCLCMYLWVGTIRKCGLGLER